MTNEQIEQKKQQLAKKVKEMKAIYDELVEAGVIELGSPLATEGTQELSEDNLGQAAGGECFGWRPPKYIQKKDVEDLQ